MMSDEEELQLRPTDPETDSARQIIMESHLPVDPHVEEPAKPRLQFGIRHLLLATTAIAIAAALLQWFAPQLLAVTIGLVALLILIVTGAVRIRDPAFTAVFWCVMALYVVYAIIASFFG